MPEQSPSFAPSVQTGHEVSGVNTRGVGFFILWFIVCGLGIHLVLWFVVGRIVHHVRQVEPPESVLKNSSAPLDQPLQPAAHHNSLPWQDMAALRDDQSRVLNSYGTLPNDPAHVHIPIDRAMELLLQNGTLTAPPNTRDTQPYINTTQPHPTENRT